MKTARQASGLALSFAEHAEAPAAPGDRIYLLSTLAVAACSVNLGFTVPLLGGRAAEIHFLRPRNLTNPVAGFDFD